MTWMVILRNMKSSSTVILLMSLELLLDWSTGRHRNLNMFYYRWRTGDTGNMRKASKFLKWWHICRHSPFFRAGKFCKNSSELEAFNFFTKNSIIYIWEGSNYFSLAVFFSCIVYQVTYRYSNISYTQPIPDNLQLSQW